MSSQEEIEFSRHALDQMRERNISQELILDVIHSPDRLHEQTDSLLQAIKRVRRDQRDYLLVGDIPTPLEWC